MTKKKKESDETLAFVAEVFEKQVPFNRALGLRVDINNEAQVKVSFRMKDKLVGNFIRGTLHGGVIFSALDVVGGLVAFVNLCPRRKSRLSDEEMALFSRLGTIDMRVDFLRPGLGEGFVATGTVLRVGRKVAVTRMELHNDEDSLIAVATGAYSTGAYTVG